MTKYHYTRMNRDNPAIGAFSTPGASGAQSGEGVRGIDPVFAQASDAGAFVPGLTGSQSGPVEESTSAAVERALQKLVGLSPMIPGGVIGYDLGGWPLAAFGASLAGKVGEPITRNASSPNIQDVWTHQLMQKLRTMGQ